MRGVLQYVPQFRGKTFVILLDAAAITEMAVAECLLDVLSLQNLGVKVALGAMGGKMGRLVDRATEIELKVAKAVESLDAERVSEILGRGQAAIFDASAVGELSAEMAGFAKALDATKVIILKNGSPVTLEGEAIPAVKTADISRLRGEAGLAGAEVLEAAGSVCEAGVPRVHLLDGSRHGVLVEELFSAEGVGTMVYIDHYIGTRDLREEDIPELLAMIGRSVRATWLVPRHYEDIRERMGDYTVLTVDDNVVGCVALHPHGEDVAELACLYVKQSHEGSGYGKILTDAVLEKGRQKGLERVFALTTKAANFFRDRLGWEELAVTDLPPSRREQWEESRRGSLVFGLDL